MTNLEKFQSLSAEELARFLTRLTECCSFEDREECNNCPAFKSCCYNSMLNWINSDEDTPMV